MDKEQAIRDEILVLRAQMGEADALAALVQGWQPRLWAFARVLTGDDEAAWDVMQDVWVAVLRDLRRLGAPARFRPWVFRIVRNKSTDRIRGAVRQRRLLQERAEHADVSAAAGQGDVREVLSSLPDADGSLLALHYLEGFSYEELAELLEIPLGTVKSRLNTARTRLRTLLEAHDGQF